MQKYVLTLSTGEKLHIDEQVREGLIKRVRGGDIGLSSVHTYDAVSGEKSPAWIDINPAHIVSIKLA